MVVSHFPPLLRDSPGWLTFAGSPAAGEASRPVQTWARRRLRWRLYCLRQELLLLFEIPVEGFEIKVELGHLLRTQTIKLLDNGVSVHRDSPVTLRVYRYTARPRPGGHRSWQSAVRSPH